VPAFGTLGLPNVLKRIVTAKRGLVLVIGPAGSGKTTTLAALIDYINSRFRKSIVTIEQPVEFVHRNKLSIIEQIECEDRGMRPSELGHPGIAEAADVIMVDGLINSASLSLGLGAAARGALALVAVESNGGAAEVLKRIVDAFPAAERQNQRRLLAQTLRGAVWQHLLPLKGPAGYRPAVEVLVNDPVISGLIDRSGALHLVRPTMAAGRARGMQTMHQALETLRQESGVEEDVIAAFENTMLAYYVYSAAKAF
jgi:twitching motility protein PilT